MSRSNVGYIAREQMERITERILSDYGFEPDDKQVRPVPIEEIVEFHYDLQIAWETIDQLDSDGVVMAAIFPDRKLIILNESQRRLFEEKIGTYHFTLAHELGHWVLHAADGAMLRSVAPAAASPYYCRSLSHKPAEEIQADLFAGCLLMPRAMMERAVRQLSMLGRFRLHHLYRLAECLKVSVSAVSVRLEQLGHIRMGSDGRIGRPDKEKAACHEQLTLDL
ncbi:ImmA/IrrE family metallo-endopeptidase [Paenibacillus hodogayensis]|uniref:ImmA/IrrE family metallo-endopeptidase n=1 Tax=Paenibacillus hodogayensis TaxID=279208 RepID=A0ABV5W5K3_9BACL